MSIASRVWYHGWNVVFATIAHRKANLEWVNPASRFGGFPGPNTVSKAALNIWLPRSREVL
jgi:hypothetical protein